MKPITGLHQWRRGVIRTYCPPTLAFAALQTTHTLQSRNSRSSSNQRQHWRTIAVGAALAGVACFSNLEPRTARADVAAVDDEAKPHVISRFFIMSNFRTRHPSAVDRVLKVFEDVPYTACYCEENVWKLCEAVQKSDDFAGSDVDRFYAVFVSNDRRQVPFFEQKASEQSDHDYFVVWDYHVFLVECVEDVAPCSSNSESAPSTVNGGHLNTDAASVACETKCTACEGASETDDSTVSAVSSDAQELSVKSSTDPTRASELKSSAHAACEDSWGQTQRANGLDRRTHSPESRGRTADPTDRSPADSREPGAADSRDRSGADSRNTSPVDSRHHRGHVSFFRVWDRDTRLGFPVNADVYVARALLNGVRFHEELARQFRVVPAREYLDKFASDRSHMLKKGVAPSQGGLSADHYIATPPSYPPIRGAGAAPSSSNLMGSFVSMKSADFGAVMSEAEFISFLRLDTVQSQE